jgi:hypothetical protein
MCSQEASNGAVGSGGGEINASVGHCVTIIEDRVRGGGGPVGRTDGPNFVTFGLDQLICI